MNEEERRLTTTDKEIVESAKTGEGLIEIKSAEQFKELARAAQVTHDGFMKKVVDLLDDVTAAYVRHLRVDEGYSWRAVAQACYLEWDGDWYPSSNQLMGMALCEKAAEFFDEHYMEEPWN